MAKKNQPIYIGLLIALIAIGALFSSGKFSTAELGGTTVLSVDRIELHSNVPELGNQPAFLINLVANGGGETLVGEITQETLEQMGIKGVKAGKFKIKVYLEEFKYNYPLTQAKYFSGEDVILWEVVGSTAKQECLAKQLPWGAVDKDTSINYFYGKPVSSDLVTTVPPIMPRGIEEHIPSVPYEDAKSKAVEVGEWGYWMPEGKVKITYVVDQWGNRRSVEYDFGAGECRLQEGGDARGDWFVTNLAGIPYARVYDISTSANKYYKIRVVLEREDGEKISAVLTPSQKVAMLADIGRVKMVGDLGGERTPEIPAVDYNVIKFLDHAPEIKTKYGAMVKPDSFKFVGKDVINTYKSNLMELADLDNNYYTYEVEEGYRRIWVDPGVGASYIIGHWNTLNNMLAASIEDTRKPSTCEIAGSVVSCEALGGVAYPMLQLLIRADWIGLEILSGVPQIVSVDVPSKVYEGDVGILKATIKNNGEVDDSFDVSLTCPAEVSTTSTRISLKAGEESEASITFTSAILGQYNCTLRMQSVNSMLMEEEPVVLTIAQKPLPEEIVMLKDIPQQVSDLAASVERLTRVVGVLSVIILGMVGLAVAIGGMYLIYRVVKK